MDNKVEIVIAGVDNASDVIGDVQSSMENLGDTSAVVAIDLAELWKNFEEAALEALSAFGDALGEVMDEAMQAEVITADLQSQLRAMGDSATLSYEELDNLASSLSNVSLYEDDVIMQAEGIMLRFGTISRETFPDAMQAAVDLAQAMGTDVATAAQTLGRVLDDPTAGLGRLSRQFGELTTEEMQAIEAFMQVGDAASAQQVILDHLARTTEGRALDATKTLSGEITMMEKRFADAQEAIGTFIINGLDQLPQPMQDAAIGMAVVGPKISALVTPLISLAGAMAQIKMAGGLATVLGLGGGGAGIVASLSGIASGAAAAATSFATMAAAALAAAAPFLLLAAAIGVLIYVVKELGPTALESLKQLDFIFEYYLKQIITAIVKWGADLSNKVWGIINGLVNKVRVWFRNVGSNIISGIWDGIQAGWSWLVSQVESLAQSLLDAATNVLGIESPSKAFADQVGKPIVQGIGAGMEKQLPTLTGGMQRTLGALPAATTGGGRGGMTIVLNYSPGVAIADRQDVSSRLVPYIREAMRRG